PNRSFTPEPTPMTRRVSAAAAACAAAVCCFGPAAAAAPVRYWGADAELTVGTVSDRTVRIALAPLDEKGAPRSGAPSTALVELKPQVKLRRRELAGPEEVASAALRVRVKLDP